MRVAMSRPCVLVTPVTGPHKREPTSSSAWTRPPHEGLRDTAGIGQTALVKGYVPSSGRPVARPSREFPSSTSIREIPT